MRKRQTQQKIKALMPGGKWIETDIPRRYRDTGPSAAERIPECMAMVAVISHNKLKPFEVTGMYVPPEWKKQYDLKEPERTITDYLRSMIDQAGLSSDYHVKKGKDRSRPGWFFIRLWNEPPIK